MLVVYNNAKETTKTEIRMVIVKIEKRIKKKHRAIITRALFV